MFIIIKKIFFSIVLLWSAMITYSILSALIRDLKGPDEGGGFLFLLRIWPIVVGIILLLAFFILVMVFSWKHIAMPHEKAVTDNKTEINP